MKFDNLRIREAFEKCNQTAPEPLGVIDTLPLLRSKFGLRAGNLKVSGLWVKERVTMGVKLQLRTH